MRVHYWVLCGADRPPHSLSARGQSVCSSAQPHPLRRGRSLHAGGSLPTSVHPRRAMRRRLRAAQLGTRPCGGALPESRPASSLPLAAAASARAARLHDGPRRAPLRVPIPAALIRWERGRATRLCASSGLLDIKRWMPNFERQCFLTCASCFSSSSSQWNAKTRRDEACGGLSNRRLRISARTIQWVYRYEHEIFEFVYIIFFYKLVK